MTPLAREILALVQEQPRHWTVSTLVTRLDVQPLRSRTPARRVRWAIYQLVRLGHTVELATSAMQQHRDRQARVNKARKLFRDGMAVPQVAAVLGVAPITARRYLPVDVDLHHQSRVAALVRDVPGLTYSEIAAHLKVAVRTVRYAVARAGLRASVRCKERCR